MLYIQQGDNIDVSGSTSHGIEFKGNGFFVNFFCSWMCNGNNLTPAMIFESIANTLHMPIFQFFVFAVQTNPVAVGLNDNWVQTSLVAKHSVVSG